MVRRTCFNGRMTATPPTDPYAQPAQPMSPADERLWSTLIHVGSIFLYWIAPLVGYLVLKDRGPFVRAHAAASLNFQITVVIAGFAIGVLSVPTFGLASLLFFPLAILVIVFAIIAAVAASKGQYYTYPLAIRFVA